MSSRRIFSDPRAVVLGWAIDHDQHPRYWRATDIATAPRRDDFVTVRLNGPRHCLIVGQSGCGKSFLLTRLVEEIVDLDLGRCVVLDPNSDFRNFRFVRTGRANKYDQNKGFGFLSHERRASDFGGRWGSRVRNYRTTSDQGRRGTERPLRVGWQYLNIDLISQRLQPLQQEKLHQWHRAVRALSSFHYRLRPRNSPGVRLAKVLTSAHELFAIKDEVERRDWIEQTFAARLRDGVRAIACTLPLDSRSPFEKAQLLRIDERIGRILRAAYWIGSEPDLVEYYRSRANSLIDDDVAALYREALDRPDERIGIYDLLSVRDPQHRLMVVSSIIEQETRHHFDEYAKGTPLKNTFIIVDEAHNVAPAAATDSSAVAVRDQIRRVAAEGRKFGLFLILVTQRPDKLDEQVVSECANKAIMHLDSPRAARDIAEHLGYDDLTRAVELMPGRALLSGPWVQHNDDPIVETYTASPRVYLGTEAVPRLASGAP